MHVLRRRRVLQQLTPGVLIHDAALREIETLPHNLLDAAFPGRLLSELFRSLALTGLLEPRGLGFTAAGGHPSSFIYEDTTCNHQALKAAITSRAAGKAGTAALKRLKRLLEALDRRAGYRLHKAVRLYPPLGSIRRHADKHYRQRRTVTTVLFDRRERHKLDFSVCFSNERSSKVDPAYETAQLQLPAGASCYTLGPVSSGCALLCGDRQKPAARTLQHQPSPAPCWAATLVVDFMEDAQVEPVLKLTCKEMAEMKA
ncbi:hypothetical protein EMIHUDRAFT_94992 [Emiliania huxleyi CCMP1516]|uniref:Fe2OG dioxygenase domain-containing protein n=2 Tax=Emiliania huxleyi TaxID=2903 RepID=A0A0D3L179_EMIH1|nr:hypothetical protein EMIHUDRAFT_94992 [Emiliania huxleyi CCMP1516]EOD41764.1 hypothetical protein EMIHUDRAFT_94992 [Emiliania huxleyi CCMP1516]|eukprot:XP_005794193.1 hypothetical protein EMIHUDRAFT_94992 [Emiliania huxleyi CCMP1516]